MPVPRPAYPQPGDDIVSSWAKSVTDFAGDKWRFVPSPIAVIITAVAQTGSVNTVECAAIPANDPTIAAIEIMARVVDPSAGLNYLCNLTNFDGTNVCVGYASGVANRGGSFGPAKVVPGGVNGRQIKYSGSSGCQISLWSCGYWVREIPA